VDLTEVEHIQKNSLAALCWNRGP